MATYLVKLKSYTKPQFMHNATAAGKLPVWTYEYWNEEDDKKKVSFTISMTKNMAGDENKQSKQMNDAAIATVKKAHTKDTVKLTSK